MKTGTLILKPIEFKSDDFNIYKESGLSKEMLDELRKKYEILFKFHTNKDGNIEVSLCSPLEWSN